MTSSSCASTIELGHALGLRVVAEGIEDSATLELLAELGCDLAQGYFISKPKAGGTARLPDRFPSRCEARRGFAARA